MHVVLFQNHLNQLIYQHKGQDHARNGNDDGFRKILDHTEHAAIPALRGLSDLPGHIRDLAVYRFKNTGVLPGDRFDQALFDPVCYPIKQTAHRLLTEQAGQERNQRGTHQGDTAARHKLFHTKIGVKLCSMAGGGVSRNLWNFFRTAPAGTGQAVTCSTSGMGLRLK